MVKPKSSQTRDQLLAIQKDKEKIEAKIMEYSQILAVNDNIGMHGPLVDAEEFPRNDIDVHRVRQARQQILCLQNDHKKLMEEIEKLLHKFHAEKQEEDQDISNGTAALQLIDAIAHGNGVTPAPGTSESNGADLKPIVKVTEVSSGSPAEDAGLRLNDEIIEFGTANSRNFDNNLNQIAIIVRHMQNQRVSLKVKRNEQLLDLILIPRTWSGRGLLGCNIVLFNNE